MHNRRVILKRAAIVAASLVALWLVCSVAVAWHYVRRAQTQHEEAVPKSGWDQIQPLRLHTSDGEELGAWFMEGYTDRPIVLFLHGVGACRSACLEYAKQLLDSGYPVLMITFRAHGDSTGTKNDFGYSSQHDVVAAVEWLEKNYPGRRIIIWGQSYGSAAAIFAAGELGPRISAYILECPYQDLRAAVWHRIKMRLPTPLDMVAYSGLLLVSPLFLPNIDQIAPVQAISKIPPSVPVLILAGSRDQHAPPKDAKALAAQISDHSEVVVIDGAEHLQLRAANPARYQSIIEAFLAKISGS
jgi:uncharacterized protein